MSGSTNLIAAGAAIIDTNILVYAYDLREPVKRPVARIVVAELARQRRLLMTCQIVNEFFVTATRPDKRRGGTPVLSHQTAAALIRRWCRAFPILPLSGETTGVALTGVERHALSFWDALIWACAKLADVKVIYTEDCQHERVVEGVQFLNPFLLPNPPAT